MKAMKLFTAIICLLMVSYTIPAFSQEVYNFELMWGSRGTGEGQFSTPSDVAADSFGNVYVADWGNDRIQRFDSDGNFITKWGSYGTGDGQFNAPSALAVDSLGNVYVADTANHRIQKFDSDGNFIRKWDIPKPDASVFTYPSGVATDLSGNVYVANIMSFGPIDPPPPPIPSIMKFDANGNLITKWGSFGTGDGQFNDPNGVAVDSSSNVYVADTGNNRIQKFDSNGNFITKWHIPAPFSNLEGIGTDLSGNVYVYTNYCCPFLSACPTIDIFSIWKFDPNGNLIAKWGDVAIDNCQFNSSGMAVNSLGSVYVADTQNNRIQKFSLKLPSITLGSPSINEHFNLCSLYSPPTFSWNVSEAFNDYEIQFSTDWNFASIPFELTAQPPATQITISSDTLKEIMMIPGASGGTVYWRVIGTRADGTTEASAVRSFSVGADPAGNPTISPTTRRSRPTLTWQNNCNTKFKVWFGSDSSFSKKTYTFEIENSTDDEGTSSKTLTLLDWLRIKMLVKNKTGSTIYWYIESWDGVGRYAKTDVMSFVLTD